MAAAVHCTQCGLEQEADARFCPACGLAISAERDEYVGQVVAERYKLLEKIGQGNSGTVYRAEHATLTKKVAVKILHHSLGKDEAAIERFRREATTVAELDNDHILQVTDFGRTLDGRLFFAMELLDGKTLTAVLAKEERLTVTRALDIAIQIGEALVEAHGLGYVHRDLKPANVFLIQRRGRQDFVKLLDFGLAKLVEPGGQMKQTAMGLQFGDPRYMAPEAVRGDAIDRRVDIYALGAILCQMLTGAPPYDGTGTFDVLQKQLDNPVPRLRDRRPELPEWLDRVVQKALAKNPEDRFVTALKLIEHLREQAAPKSDPADAAPVVEARPASTGSAVGVVTPAASAPVVEATSPTPANTGAKDTLMLGRLRAPEPATPVGTNGSGNGAPQPNAPSPSISPIVSTQKMSSISAAEAANRSTKSQKRAAPTATTPSGKQVRVERATFPAESQPPAVAIAGQTSVAKDAHAANSTSGEVQLSDRQREPSQKVPTVMFDSAVEALGPEQRPPTPKPAKPDGRRPGAVVTRPGLQPNKQKPAATRPPDEVESKAAAPELIPSDDNAPRGDEPSGETDWFKTGPKLDDDEELEPITKSRTGVYAGLGVGGVVVLIMLVIALWPRAPKPAVEASEKPAPKPAAPAPAETASAPTPPATTTTTAPPAPTTPAPNPVIVTPLPTPTPPAPTPPAPVAEPVDEGRIVPARVEDKKRPKEEFEKEIKEPKEPKVAVAKAPPTRPIDELRPFDGKPAKEPKEPKEPKDGKPGKTLPVGFKDPFSEQTRSGDPAQAATLVKSGRAKLQSGDLAGALAQFNKAREADPNSADALAGLGEVSFEHGDYTAAAGYLKQALRNSPNRPRYIVLLGQAYYKLGRARDAANEYRRALRLDPDNEEAQRSLELAEKKLGN